MLIKYRKSFLWRVAKRLSYIEDARCLKFNVVPCTPAGTKKKEMCCCSHILKAAVKIVKLFGAFFNMLPHILQDLTKDKIKYFTDMYVSKK